MKSTTIIKTFMCAFIAVAAVSCKKSTTTTTAPPPAAAGFTYKADGGTTITVDSANAVLYNLNGSREMDVYAFKGGLQVLEFHFKPLSGTQSAAPGLGNAALLTYITGGISFDSQSGSLVITACDTTGNNIVGDFNFVGKEYPFTATTTHIVDGHMVVTKITKQ